ncbi:hypothetical protein [Candidatus Uabimicrobium amorphum]|uniref:Uncharacterized protein n=1 Tax=Uabimicrobium amorphum TaxID=2596890 RepID=A0A5S9IRV0_UABAM|nr:hypothetical protein [Candidatus Uabimicrobium amorphum]BBM86010.1 hypothetical protein UABAM_04396 [Candidatus Uabimicrobium amorphum]
MKVIFLLMLAICGLSASLDKQYLQAYEFARNPRGLNYTHGQAFLWAKKFVETKGVFRQKILVAQYQEAFDFATEFLEISTDEADIWAKNLILRRGTIPLRADISSEMNTLLNRITFTAEDGKTWVEEFLFSSAPLYTKLDMLDMYRDVYLFCRTNYLVAVDDETARKMANKFVQNRFRFYSDRNLVEQYVVAFEFAFNSEGLRLSFEESVQWAQSYIKNHGVISRELGLGDQYREAFLFARSSGGLRLSDEESVQWARGFVQAHAQFSLNQGLLDKYQESFLFAYNGEVLEMLTKMRDAPPGVFLVDEAQKYARNLVQSRTEINPLGNLLTQYQNAFVFAHSSDGLRLEYYKAKSWAKKFMEYRVQR